MANLRAMHDLDIELVARNPLGKTHKSLGLSRRRDFGAVLNSYQTITAEVIKGTVKVISTRLKSLYRQFHLFVKDEQIVLAKLNPSMSRNQTSTEF